MMNIQSIWDYDGSIFIVLFLFLGIIFLLASIGVRIRKNK